MKSPTPCQRFIEQLQLQADNRADLTLLEAHSHLLHCDQCHNHLKHFLSIDSLSPHEFKPLVKLSPSFLEQLQSAIPAQVNMQITCNRPPVETSSRKWIAWTSACLLLLAIFVGNRPEEQLVSKAPAIEVAKADAKIVVIQDVAWIPELITDFPKKLANTSMVVTRDSFSPMTRSFESWQLGFVSTDSIQQNLTELQEDTDYALESISQSVKKTWQSIGEYSPAIPSWF